MSRGNAEEEAETGTKMISHQKYTFEVSFDTDFECILLAPVFRKAESAIHRINHYPADSVVCFVNTYPLDSDLSGG